ncbi:sodium/hydrogen exchanger 9B1-like [Cylas formicarius]|uniref:sodium/hydrogen exchanger 9B1-like n=1 Tax=Cylas formicarius TaxID=197179 RepID=UPI0029586BA4|nr:sodium/hydrogen exchanger 9B1-like [Cylas formicarius]XP_060517633.1 sodium/hydrogen exchanger 9B1-like [Cylas formicarius]XP_060517634.1 sodium/hydrogen exchanger 9B1-like [Cylas formicarius]XP_060517635.1 sodium/hydrogen exchanger 9B1-like [Cylas formicarius]
MTKYDLKDGDCNPEIMKNNRNGLSGLDNPALVLDREIHEPRTRKLSSQSTASRFSKTRFSDNGDDNPRSWWYAFCLKCRSKESTSSWEPPYWSYLCPYPFCPTFRRFSRVVTLIILGIVSWYVFYTIVGDPVAPQGPIFQLIILVIISKLGGWVISLANLPGLIGMLFTGLLLQNVGVVNLDSSLSTLTKNLRSTALVIILIRAGLDLDPTAIRRLKFSILLVGLLPWLVEAGVICAATHLFLHLPWDYGFALGSVVAAVSPAVTVPCLLRLRSKGYGVSKGIPTLIIAIAGIDDAASVAVFRIMQSVMFSASSLTNIIVQGPVSVIGGIGFGIFWGILAYFFPEKGDPYVVPMRVFLLFAGCMLSVFGSTAVGYGGAGPLACVVAAFTSIIGWMKQGWNNEENPVAVSFEIIWMFFEPILFGITGAQIRLNELDGQIVLIGVGILIASSIIRILSTVLFGIKSGLNLKEKLFSAIALMSKATVQAALAPALLSLVPEKSEEHSYAEKFLMISILAIILTAPTSAILMTFLGPKMLTRTKPINAEELRRSSRRSLRDITIEEDEQNQDSIVTIDANTKV